MAKNFTETTIPICGDNYYFKRCSNQTLVEFDKKIEDEYKSLQTLIKEVDNLSEKQERLEKKISRKENKIDLMQEKEALSDKEIDKILKLEDEVEELENELYDIKKQLSDLNDEHPENINREFSDKVNSILADKVEALLDGITAKEFIDKADPVDINIARNIEKYYQMCIVGEREKKIQQEIKDDVSEFLKSQKEIRNG